ncbi:MAG: adenylate kinase [Hymenobacter sp.]|nr:MAG: adenylate kinase [Hymenobacter sp.]
MKVHIFGASGAGATTLGQALSAVLKVPYFDTDAYFWEATDPPFTVRRPAAVRDAQLTHDLTQNPGWIVGGSLVGWDESWLAAFDLAVFLWLPPALRLIRLHQREQARYGEAIRRDPARAAQAKAFLAWAAGYDDNSSGGSRTLANHTAWLGRFACPVLELRGDRTVAERVQSVQARLRELGLSQGY